MTKTQIKWINDPEMGVALQFTHPDPEQPDVNLSLEVVEKISKSLHEECYGRLVPRPETR